MKKTTVAEIILNLNRMYKRAVMEYEEKVQDNDGDGFHKNCLYAKGKMETLEILLGIYDPHGEWNNL